MYIYKGVGSMLKRVMHSIWMAWCAVYGDFSEPLDGGAPCHV